MERILELKNITCVDGGTANVKDGVLYYGMSNGEWPEIQFDIDGLKGYNSVSFDIKINSGHGVALILCSGKLRAISGTDTVMNKRETPNNEWLSLTWYFRANPGWVTPPSVTPIDFDKAFKFCFAVDGKYGDKFEAQIKNIVFSDKNVELSDNEEFEAFKKTYKSGSLENKKALIWAWGYGNDSGTVSNVIDTFSYYEKQNNYDGLILEFNRAEAVAFRDSVFTPEELDENALESTVKQYNEMDWKHFKHNFFRLDIVGASRFKDDNGNNGKLDWFDDDLFYNKIYPKLTKVALALKRMNASLMFDNEAYTTEPYDYYYKYSSTGKSFEEYKEIVFKRGKEFAEVFSKAYPNATIMTTYGNWVIVLEGADDRYALLPSFIDGMCAADTNLKIIDGYERGYGFAATEKVLRGVFDCTTQTVKHSKIPEVYNEKMNYGFAVWLRTDFLEKQLFADILKNALKESEEYVWIYTEASPIQREDVQEYLDYAGKAIKF